MKAMIFKYWDRLRSSFWFLPSFMAVTSAELAILTIALDKGVTNPWLEARGWVYTGGAEGAALVLGTIAGSMITIAGVVFSMTLVAMTLASSQFGPRLLRNFMRDTANQVVLGTFIATFLYCLLVLGSIRRGEALGFVPHLSVTIGVLFAIASIGVLIYFIHHVAVSIQGDVIVARVGAELIRGIDRLFPGQVDQGESRPANEACDLRMPEEFDRQACLVAADGDGYLRRIDADALMRLAVKEDALIRLERRPGQYVVWGSPLAKVWPGERVTDQFVAQMNSAFVLGNQRTPDQDIEFSVDQLVEVAARALSSGVNDPFTAIACVDRLGSALAHLARREMPSPYRLDEQNRLRVVAHPVAFAEIVDAAFNQIRQDSRSNASLSIRLLETIATIARAAHRPEDRAVLHRHAEMIVSGAREGLPEAGDRRAVLARYHMVTDALREAGESRHLSSMQEQAG